VRTRCWTVSSCWLFWVIRHIQGEDQGLARRLRALGKTPLHVSVTDASPVERSSASAPAWHFSDVLVQGSAALHASEEDVPALLEQGSQAAMLIALDAALLPMDVLRANTAAARFFGCSVEQLEAYPGNALFGARGANGLPVLMGEVLMHGHFAGPLVCVGPEGRATTSDVQITHLMSRGRMAILVVFGEPAASSSAPETEVSVESAVDAVSVRARSVVSSGLGGSLLSRHALFQCMTRDERIRLEQASQLISLPKGDVLFDQGDEPEGLYMVISGQMSLVVRSERGAEKVLAVSAQSLSSTVLLMIPAEDLRRIQSTSTDFACAVVDHLGKRLHDLTAEIQALTLHTAMERIIDHLLEHARMDDDGVLEATLPAQKKVIASYLNLSPPTLSRAFQHLTDTGLITISRSLVAIPDCARLVNYRNQGCVE